MRGKILVLNSKVRLEVFEKESVDILDLCRNKDYLIVIVGE